MRRIAAAVMAVMATSGMTASAAAIERDTMLVSRASGITGAKADGESNSPVISADGRYVAFVSSARNLVAEPTTGTQVYVRDLVAATTTLVSRADGQGGAVANGDSGPPFGPRISADGRYVAFTSVATNLDPDDTDATQAVYVRDIVQGETTLVSRANGPSGVKPNSFSQLPAIAGDGQSVAFETSATNLGADFLGRSSSGMFRRAAPRLSACHSLLRSPPRRAARRASRRTAAESRSSRSGS